MKRDEKAVPLEAVMARLPAARRKKVAARATVLMAEELSREDFRTARKRARTALGRKLKIEAKGIAQLEARCDLLIGALAREVAKQGGALELAVTYPRRSRVVLGGVGKAVDEFPKIYK